MQDPDQPTPSPLKMELHVEHNIPQEDMLDIVMQLTTKVHFMVHKQGEQIDDIQSKLDTLIKQSQRIKSIAQRKWHIRNLRIYAQVHIFRSPKSKDVCPVYISIDHHMWKCILDLLVY